MSLPTLTIAANIQKMETKTTNSGSTVTTLSLSCGDKNKDGNYDNLYIDASFWNKQSDFVSQHFHEGSAIIVTGKLITTNYMKQDGTKVYKTQFHFPQASFVPKDRDTQQNNQPQGQAPQQNYNQPQAPSSQAAPAQNQQGTPPVIDIDEDLIPFNYMRGDLYV